MENLQKFKALVRGKKIVLVGPPGCGKGNRSDDLKALGLVHVASGIALRARVRDDSDSELSQKALEFMKQGDLVPDEIVDPIVMEHLNRQECRENGFVLDGFPRNKAQAEILFSRIDIDLVLHLDVPRKHLVYGVVQANRRSCVDCAAGYSDFTSPKVEGVCDKCGGKIVKRADDNAETVENRLNLYEEETKPILPDLEVKGILEVLPITVTDDDEIDVKYLKKLRGEVYWTETDQGEKTRMLNFEGMRERLYNLLAEKLK
ncbi:MAG: nucleoside monophosphate kinase [Deltaproteobacteria bacterium]|nr:nucleoside monophosphate kinase [Deltaproteobacteria bacterium]